jgi:hypothetical protein
MSIGLLTGLFRSVDFLWSIGFDVVGIAGQFVALIFGPISVVQPVLSLGLVLAIVIERRLARRSLSVVELLATLAVALLLTAFVVLRGTSTTEAVSSSLTVLVSLIVFGGCAILYLVAKRTKERLPTLLVASFGALSLGCASVLEREVGLQIDVGVVHALTGYQLWILLASAPLSLLLTQSAFQFGELKIVLPILTVGEPLVAMVLGRFMVGEPLFPSQNLLWGLAALIGLACSLIVLARSESIFRSAVSDSTSASSEGDGS